MKLTEKQMEFLEQIPNEKDRLHQATQFKLYNEYINSIEVHDAEIVESAKQKEA